MAQSALKRAGPSQSGCRPRVPRQFWDDQEWALENYQQLALEYPDEWVAIADKKVVSHGTDIAEMQRSTRSKTRRKHIPILFVEGSAHVYHH